MTGIKLTHANLGSTIYIVKEHVGFYYHSPAGSCTNVTMTGGAIFPAKETVEYVTRLMGMTFNEGETNGQG